MYVCIPVTYTLYMYMYMCVIRTQCLVLKPSVSVMVPDLPTDNSMYSKHHVALCTPAPLLKHYALSRALIQ